MTCIQIRPSRHLLFWLLGLHTLALLAVTTFSIPKTLLFLFWLCITASLLYHLHSYYGLAAGRIMKIMLNEQGAFELWLENGNCSMAQLKMVRDFFSFFLILDISIGSGKIQRIFVFKDSVTKAEYKHLLCQR